MRLGILQCGHTPDGMPTHQGDYDQKFVELLGADSFDYTTWAVVDNVFPPNVEAADAWLLTGSRYGAYEKHDWIPPLESFIREIYAADVPMVGICFGHQIMAQALGGKVEKFSGGWSVGRVTYQLNDSPDGRASVMAFHQDQVVELPPEATVVGSTDFCRYAALVYGDKAFSLQPHPEFDGEFIAGLVDVRGDILPDDIKATAMASIDEPLSNDVIAARIRNFLKRET